jgi:SdpI/YfhL protein family
MMSTQPFAIPAAIVFLAALPLALGLVPRNRFFGFRTIKTLSEDSVWYPVNRLAGLATMAASVIYGAVAAAWPYERAARFSIWGLHLAAFVLPLAVALALAAWYARKL